MGAQRICFVVMGFGKKTDHESGRTLDLNATYREIIKPSIENAGLTCIRADEISHSGLIDTHMYDMLLRADLVIADISTANPNAIYELGVRHALKPYSTIILKENKGRFHFDLNHVSTFEYSHLGDDIGASEARRAIADLTKLITSVLLNPTPDSPVYTFIPRLNQPLLSEEEITEIIKESEDFQEEFSHHYETGEECLRLSNFDSAVHHFQSALNMRKGDPYLIQRLTLATYKSEKPTPIAALISASKIIEVLVPSESNDPETLGLVGAIQKRLWLISGDVRYLDLAIKYYSRGFEIKKDYYNGENFALCLNYRAGVEDSSEDKIYYTTHARKIRESLIEIIKEIEGDDDFDDRNDKKWIFATMANSLFGLGNDELAKQYEGKFISHSSSDWERETYFQNKEELLGYIE